MSLRVGKLYQISSYFSFRVFLYEDTECKVQHLPYKDKVMRANDIFLIIEIIKPYLPYIRVYKVLFKDRAGYVAMTGDREAAMIEL
jgi:hypothetical protein